MTVVGLISGLRIGTPHNATNCLAFYIGLIIVDMKTSDFDYDLPQELIAQTPAEPRDNSRLMVVNRDGGRFEHCRFHDLPEYLRAGDLLVFNDSRVIPARLYGERTETGGKIEVLLLSRLSEGLWRALVRPGRRMREGAAFVVRDEDGRPAMRGEVVEVEAEGTRLVRLEGEKNLHKVGIVPLPPYIHEPLADRERYQTVYSRVAGSVAAPTAGLHFTPELLERVRSMGVETAFVTLHVGWDSFRPVKTDDVAGHKMHSEFFSINGQAADLINGAKRNGRRVISVGTTAVRLLEHSASLSNDGDGKPVRAGEGWADIFIAPGFRFRVVDALVTNFHLPRSTLLMLTSALAGRDLVLKAYEAAVAERYRFYSFGDAMVIM